MAHPIDLHVGNRVRQRRRLLGMTQQKLADLERLKVDPAIEADQCRHLADLRGRRDTARVAEKLDCLEDAARGHEKLVPIFIDAVESDVTLGEICKVLRGVWGEYQPPAFL